MELRFLSSINEVSADIWNGSHQQNPFLKHAFFEAMESSGCVSADRGWQAMHALLEPSDSGVAQIDAHADVRCVLPLYVKGHSQGEYVFDHVWANAYYQHGRPYYPKLLTAVPYTPIKGKRLLATTQESTILGAAIEGVKQQVQRLQLSSWHVLFPDPAEAEQWLSAGFLSRIDCHFQWVNRDYTSFDDFLSLLTSKKRKNVKRERRLVDEQGITVQRVKGKDISPEQWQVFYAFYADTYHQRGQKPYLTLGVFKAWAEHLSDQMMMVIASHQGSPVAGALFFESDDTLYGRYWGATIDVDCLHFECCYYQGIEYCIEKGLKRFDPGVQGEHKIPRGFEPVMTTSYHWIEQPDFRRAIAEFLDQEQQSVNHYRQQVLERLPFKDKTLTDCMSLK